MEPVVYTATTPPAGSSQREIWRLALARLETFELHCKSYQRTTWYALVVNGERHELGPLFAARRAVRERWPLPPKPVGQMQPHSRDVLDALKDGEWHTAAQVAAKLRLRNDTAAARLKILEASNLLDVERGTRGFHGTPSRWRLAAGEVPIRPEPVLVARRFQSPTFQSSTLQHLDEDGWKTTQDVAIALAIDDSAAYARLSKLRSAGLVEAMQVTRRAPGRPQLQWRRLRREAA